MSVWGPGARSRTIVLIGPRRSGKTTAFYALQDGEAPLGTVASMQENAVSCVLASEPAAARALELVDLPGHPALRHTLTARLRGARAVVLVIDSVEFIGVLRDVAELTYDVLSDPAMKGTPLLVACNKSDQGVKAHSCRFIEKRLEGELNSMRETRTATLASDQDTKPVYLGVAHRPFSFDQVSNQVRFVAVSAKTGDLQAVTEFIRAHCPA